MDKVFVILKGGMVFDAKSTTSDVEVVVCDYDLLQYADDPEQVKAQIQVVEDEMAHLTRDGLLKTANWKHSH